MVALDLLTCTKWYSLGAGTGVGGLGGQGRGWEGGGEERHKHTQFPQHGFNFLMSQKPDCCFRYKIVLESSYFRN